MRIHVSFSIHASNLFLDARSVCKEKLWVVIYPILYIHNQAIHRYMFIDVDIEKVEKNEPSFFGSGFVPAR